MQRNHLQHESYSSEAYLKGAEFLYINKTFMKFSFVGFFGRHMLFRYMSKYLWMKVQLISSERESKQLEKSLLMYAFISYPDKISICECSCCIEEWKRKNDAIICYERLSSITFEKKLTKNIETKPVFLPEKHSCFLKKKVSTSSMKKLLHPSEISVKFQINILFSLHHIKFTDVKKEIYFKILLNFLWNIF